MYTIQIVVYCPQEHAEILPSALESAALAIEERVGLVLLELFGSVHIDTVSVTYSQQDRCGNQLPPTA